MVGLRNWLIIHGRGASATQGPRPGRDSGAVAMRVGFARDLPLRLDPELDLDWGVQGKCAGAMLGTATVTGS